MYRFNSFTQKANDVLNLAIKAAENFGHTYVGSEHILVGLLKEGTGVGAIMLEEKGVALEKIEGMIKENIGLGTPTRLSPDDFTPRSKRIIEVSFQIARGMLNSFVGTEHILLALLRESDSYAVDFLNACGVDEHSLLEEVCSSLGKSEDSFKNTSSKNTKRGKSSTPTLDEFGKDLTEAAGAGQIGRAHV